MKVQDLLDFQDDVSIFCASADSYKKCPGSGPSDEDAFFRHDIQTVTKATELIARFNQEMSGKDGKEVFLNQPEVWHQIVPDSTGKHPKCLVEPFIDGTYIKFNSNSGYADEDYAYMQGHLRFYPGQLIHIYIAYIL